MLTAYIVIGIVMFIVTICSVLSKRDVDGADMVIALIIFGLLWPIAASQMFFMVTIDLLNKLRK